MSESPNNRPPQSSGPRGSGGSGGFNWRLLVLFSIALVILVLAFVSPGARSDLREMSYAEFRSIWDQGLVIVGDEERLLKVITSDNAYDAKISGYMNPYPEQAGKAEPTAFRVPVNLLLQDETIRDLFGEKLSFRQVEELPIKDDGESLTLAALRKSYARGEVLVGDEKQPLELLATPGSFDGVLVGVREVRQTTESQGDAVRFEVSVPLMAMEKEVNQLLASKATYERKPDYLRTALFTFLPNFRSSDWRYVRLRFASYDGMSKDAPCVVVCLEVLKEMLKLPPHMVGSFQDVSKVRLFTVNAGSPKNGSAFWLLLSNSLKLL